MEEILAKIDYDIQKDPEIIAAAIIDGKNIVIYSTDNWNISEDIEHINSIWGKKEERYLYLTGNKYTILQNTLERLIAVSINKTKKKVISQESIVGFKDSERTVLCKIPQNPGGQSLLFAVPKTANILRELSSNDPYIKPEKSFGEVKEFDLTPKILSDTSRVFEKLGINRMGISEDEAKVYLSLLRKGENGEKIGNLDKELDLKRTHIYRIIDRLVERDWVEKIAIFPKAAKIFVAKPILDLIEGLIKEKKEEIKILKGFKLVLGENIQNGWKIDTSDTRDLKEPFDIEIQEIIGFEKDCGIVVFEYDRLIKDEENLDRVKLRLYSEKIKHQILEHNIMDLENIKIVESKIDDYLAAEVQIKFIENSITAKNLSNNWVNVAKLVAIPIDNRIYVIWGSEQKFPYLMNIIKNLK